MLPEKAEIVIIGAGIMGACTAYYLAKKGFENIVVLEKEDYLGGHTTSRCAGGFRYQFSNEINVRLSMLSIELMKQFKEEHDCSYELEECGYLFLLSDKDDLEKYKSFVSMQNSLGIKTQWLDSEQIAKMIPMVNTDDIICGTYCKNEGLVDPGLVVQSYITEAKKLNVEFYSNVTVTDIQTAEKKIEAVHTNQGTIKTKMVINAAGPWAGEIGKMVQVNIPIKPVKQQLMATSNVSWMSKEFPVIIFQNEGIGFHREGNGLLTGLNKPEEETISFDESVDQDWELLHCEKAIERIPDIEELSITSSWTGFYEVTRDDLPILGKIESVEGFYCIAGFSGHGFMHGPICGELLSEEIKEGCAKTLDIHSLNLLRFEQSQDDTHESYKI